MLSTISLLTSNLQVELKFKEHSSLNELQCFFLLKIYKILFLHMVTIASVN